MPALLRLFLSIGLGAALQAADPVLTLVSADRTVALTEAEFGALARTECTVTDSPGGGTIRYTGVAVRDLLERLDAPLGTRLRGSALQLAVLVRARDGYAVVFSLADFDATFSDRTIVLADRADDKPLAEAGPLRLVLTGDKRATRSVRSVISIELVRVGPVAPVPGHP